MRRALPLILALLAATGAEAQVRGGADGCRRAPSRSLVFERSAGVSDEKGDLGLKVRLDRAAPVYAVNETLYLEVSTAKDAIVEVWQFDPRGRLAKLFPRDGAPPLRLKAGEVRRLPGQDLRLRVTPPTGMNELRVIARADAPPASVAKKPPTRGLNEALAGRAVRQERQICFTVVKP